MKKLRFFLKYWILIVIVMSIFTAVSLTTVEKKIDTNRIQLEIRPLDKITYYNYFERKITTIKSEDLYTKFLINLLDRDLLLRNRNIVYKDNTINTDLINLSGDTVPATLTHNTYDVTLGKYYLLEVIKEINQSIVNNINDTKTIELKRLQDVKENLNTSSAIAPQQLAKLLSDVEYEIILRTVELNRIATLKSVVYYNINQISVRNMLGGHNINLFVKGGLGMVLGFIVSLIIIFIFFAKNKRKVKIRASKRK